MYQPCGQQQPSARVIKASFAGAPSALSGASGSGGWQNSNAITCGEFRKKAPLSHACDTLCRGLATGKRPASDTFGTFAILRKVGKSPQFVRYDFAPESGIM
jgi:hypothetical protein